MMMNRLLGIFFLALTLLVPAAPLLHASGAFAEERQEVKERLELNSVSANQLVDKGIVDMELAKKIIKLRDELGGFQSYDDLNELNIPKDTMDKIHFNTTIKGIASDCTC